MPPSRRMSEKRRPSGACACPAADLREIFNAAGSADKTMHVIQGAKHYYQGQPELLAQATGLTLEWMRSRRLLGD